MFCGEMLESFLSHGILVTEIGLGVSPETGVVPRLTQFSAANA